MIGSTPSLLVVEDDLGMQAYLRDVLTSEKLALAAATDGQSGLELASTVHPDLILLDLGMPKMDGITFCKRIRSNPCTQHIPIIVVTGVLSPEQLTESIEAGADDFVSKPVDPQDLLNRVRSMIKWKDISDPVERISHYTETVAEVNRKRLADKHRLSGGLSPQA